MGPLPTEPGLTDANARRLDRSFDRLEREMPHRAARVVHWLREPSSRWVRIPMAVLLTLGGVFSVLPVLGLWMLPLGMALIALDVPFLKRPVAGLMIRGERRWTRWRRTDRTGLFTHNTATRRNQS
jgi:hypothetical protein